MIDMYSRNNLYFHDIVDGQYGRKVSIVDYEEVNNGNVLKILADTIADLDFNIPKFKYLWNYKKGDQPIFYRQKISNEDICNKVSENHAWEIVQFKLAQSYGEPIQCISTSDDEKVNKAVEELNKYFKKKFKFQRNVVQGEWRSAVGTSYIAIQRTHDDKTFRIVVPTPLNTYAVYSRATGEHIATVQRLQDEEGKTYYMVFTDSVYFKIQNGKIKESAPHVMGGIPIIEVPNNQDRISDIEIVITLLDSINNMQSNRMDGVEQFIQSWLKFVNCDIDVDTFNKMKEQHALVVKSNNGDGNKADVDIMTQELNQTQSQVAKDDLWNNTLSILAIPNKEGNTGGDTQGAVELRNGWDFSKNRAKLSDAFIIEAETKLAEVVLEVLRVDEKGLGITVDDFEINIPHSPQDNMTVKANVFVLLVNNGIHPLIAAKTCGLWNDAENVYLLSKPYMDVLFKTIDNEIENIPDKDIQMQKANEIIQGLNNQKNKDAQ